METNPYLPVSFTKIKLAIVENEERHRTRFITEWKKYYPASILFEVEYINEMDKYLQEELDIVVCDVCIDKSEKENIEKRAGLGLLAKLRQHNENLILIAWTFLPKSSIAEELEQLKVHYIQKNKTPFQLISELKKHLASKS